jgi:uroporphyrinogen-III decarboxylase
MANPMLDIVRGLIYGNILPVGKLSPSARVFATLMGKRGDIVPFLAPQIHDHAMTVAKVPARKYYFDAELLVNAELAVERWYGFDAPMITADNYNFELEALGAKMVYSDYGMPTVDTNQPLIKERADLDRLGELDPTKGRIPVGVEIARLSATKGLGLFANGLFCSPFSFICGATGYPKAVRALRKDPAFARELFDYAENKAIFPYLKAQAKAGVKQTIGADAWAAFPNLTPEMTDEWVVPSALRLKQRGKKELKMRVSAGAAAADYCEEDPAKFNKEIMFKCLTVALKLMPMDLTMTVMGRTQDWNMEWVQEFALKNKKRGRKLPIYASLNGRFVRDSTPQQIVHKIREWINIMGRDGGLLFFIGNVPADTPPVNVHTAFQAVHKLGRYPIARDLSAITVEPHKFTPFDDWLKSQPEADVIFKAREKK